MRLHYFYAGGIAVVAGLGLILPAAAGAATRTTTVNVIAGKPSELRFTLSKQTFPHGTVAFKLTNAGALAHDLKICASPKGGSANSCPGKVTKLIGHGQSVTLTYTFKTKGTYEYLCTVPGHAAAGMKGDVKVT
jgi:uncharacterized cupredoxin-like copper-binding protein